MILEKNQTSIGRTTALIVPTPTLRPARLPRGWRSTLHSANGFSELEGKYRRSALGECSLREGTRVETANFGNCFILAIREKKIYDREDGAHQANYISKVRRDLKERYEQSIRWRTQTIEQSDKTVLASTLRVKDACLLRTDNSIPRHGRVGRGREERSS